MTTDVGLIHRGDGRIGVHADTGLPTFTVAHTPRVAQVAQAETVESEENKSCASPRSASYPFSVHACRRRAAIGRGSGCCRFPLPTLDRSRETRQSQQRILGHARETGPRRPSHGIGVSDVAHMQAAACSRGNPKDILTISNDLQNLIILLENIIGLVSGVGLVCLGAELASKPGVRVTFRRRNHSPLCRQHLQKRRPQEPYPLSYTRDIIITGTGR